ncbi:MAG: hypothetical protein HGA72_05290 [Chlorobiaceae bacterium]|nr:hypothetical protein [Chlorobiaceae bacterium]
MRLAKAFQLPVAIAVSCTLLTPVPVKAEHGRNTRTVAAAVAAAAIVGLAVNAANHQGHYKDGRRYDNDRDSREFDRGYRDGLYDTNRNNYNHTEAYRDGYRAGQDERDLRVSHNQSNRWEQGRHVADSNMMYKATDEAERYWNLPRGSATPVRSSYNEDSGNYRVVVAAGYLRGVCVLDRYGSVIRFEDKRD